MTVLPVGPALVQLIKCAYQANTPVFVEGPHGVGKSDMMGVAASELGIDVHVIDLSLCEPTDLVGLPILDDSLTRFAPPASLPRSGRGLLVLEELNRAPRHVRSPCLQLLTARRLNDYALPGGWLPVACANPSPDLSDEVDDAQDVYDVEALDPALLSRFVRVRVRPDADAWVAWAEANEAHPAVVEVVRREGQAALETREGNPRSWTYASRFLKAFDSGPASDEVIMAALMGVLGDHWGLERIRQPG